MLEIPLSSRHIVHRRNVALLPDRGNVPARAESTLHRLPAPRLRRLWLPSSAGPVLFAACPQASRWQKVTSRRTRLVPAGELPWGCAPQVASYGSCRGGGVSRGWGGVRLQAHSADVS